MLDLNRTMQLIKDGLMDPEPTWRAYLPEAHDWQKTAFLLTGPLIIVSSLVAYTFGILNLGNTPFAMFRPTLTMTLINIVMGGVGIAIVSFTTAALSGYYGGKNSFAYALAAASLAFIPGYLGQMLTWIPWLGGFAALGMAIWGLVNFWKIIPMYLEVPEDKRALHFVLTLVATILAVGIASTVIGRFLYPSVVVGQPYL